MNIAHMRFDGDFDVARRPEVRRAFEHLAQEDAVVVDLRSANSIDSTFLTELLRFAQLAEERAGGYALLVAPASRVRRILTLAGVDRSISAFAQESEAHAYLEGWDSARRAKRFKPRPPS